MSYIPFKNNNAPTPAVESTLRKSSADSLMVASEGMYSRANTGHKTMDQEQRAKEQAEIKHFVQ